LPDFFLGPDPDEDTPLVRLALSDAFYYTDPVPAVVPTWADMVYPDPDPEPAERQRVSRFRCTACSIIHETVESGLCRTCGSKALAAREARESGGRRFGVEIEVEWPESEPDYDEYGDRCNCGDCRGGDAPSAETIAAAIVHAGVPCISIGYTHEVLPNHWKVVSDGSLSGDGWELVSPPLQWAQAGQIRTVCRVLSELGAEPTEDCGLHVHHDVGDIDVAGMKRLMRRWQEWQQHTDSLCARYRSNGEWCRHYDRYDLDHVIRHEHRSLSQLTYDMDRYQSLNISCFSNYGTVEVRQHESTLNPEEILSWVAYGQAVIDAALTDEPIEADDVEELIDALPIRADDAGPPVRERLKAKARRGRYY
jgi:hypothetical protein